MRVLWVAAMALLLAGCSNAPPPAEDAAQDPGGVAPTLVAPPVPLRFSSGDSESITTYTKTFQPTDTCFPQCQGTAEQFIDLTDVIPADAPVEIAVGVSHDGSISSALIYTDAQPVRTSVEGQGGGGGGGGNGETQISAIVVRGSEGTVQLRLRHSFANPAGGPDPIDANVEIRSVVRADVLTDSVPALIEVPGNTTLKLTEDVDRFVMFLSDGLVLYDLDGPFELTVPAEHRGPVTIVSVGGSSQVTGPNTTMQARRVQLIEGDAKAIASPATTTTLDAPSPPFQVGLRLVRQPSAAPGVYAAPFMGPYTVTITNAGNFAVVDETPDCDDAGGQVCEFPNPFSFGSQQPQFYSDELDERLTAGTYTYQVSVQNTNGYSMVPMVRVFAP